MNGREIKFQPNKNNIHYKINILCVVGALQLTILCTVTPGMHCYQFSQQIMS